MKEFEDFDIKIGGIQEEPIREKPMPRGIPLGTPMDNDPVIFISQEAYTTINHHASSNLQQEVGGVLVGDVYLCPDSKLYYLVIEAAITAKLTKAGGGHVTFTHNTWGEIWQEMDERFSKKKILGWYHTHPGMSVFLSGADMFVQTNFFSRPWQVALVVDPVRHIAGFFQWHEGKIRQCSGFFEVGRPEQTKSTITWQRAGIAVTERPTKVPEPERALTKAPQETTRSKQLLKIVSVYAVLVTLALFVVGALFYLGRPQKAESIAGLQIARSNAGAGVDSIQDCIYVFGGQAQDGNPVTESERLCLAFNNNDVSWEKWPDSIGVHGYMGWIDEDGGVRYCIVEASEEGDLGNKVWLSLNFSPWYEQEKTLKPARDAFTTIGFGDYVYVIGGKADDQVLDSVVHAKIGHEPALTLNGWNTSTSQLVFARYDAAAVVWHDINADDKAFLYVIGGRGDDGEPFSGVEGVCINMTTGYIDAWREVRSLRTARADSAAVVVDNYIYVAGGIDKEGHVLGSIERAEIDPYGNLQDWEMMSMAIEPRYALTAIALDNEIYFIGGIDVDGRALNTVQVIKHQ